MSIATVGRSNITGHKSKTLLTAKNAVNALSGSLIGTYGTPFNKSAGQSATGPGIVTYNVGALTIDGVLVSTSYPMPLMRFNSSASSAGYMSGLLLPSVSDAIAIPTRTTGPTIYSNSVGASGGYSENTFTVSSIGTNMGLLTGVNWYTSHSNVNNEYPPNLDWQWWLYVNSADTGNTDVQIWYASHNTGSYSRYDTNQSTGLVIPYRGTLKLRMRTDPGGANSVAYGNVGTYT